MKHSVIYTKPLKEIDPKTKRRSTIPVGTREEVTDERLAGIRHAVRVIKPRRSESKAKAEATE